MVNILLATWLFVTAFAFNPSPPQFWSMLIVSVGVVTFECLSIWRDQLRYVDAALGAWLILSIWVLPTRNEFIYWNNCLVGILIVALSMVRTRVKGRPWVESRDGYQRATEDEVREMGKVPRVPTRQPT
jgi:hypothetical protein